MDATRPTHLIRAYLITVIRYDRNHKLRKFSVRNSE